MKIEAYRCDFCGNIKEAEATVGVSTQEDIFEKLKSYPIIANPAKATVHHCTDCYNIHVLQIAEATVNRKKDEYLYKLKIDELSLSLRTGAVMRAKKGLER